MIHTCLEGLDSRHGLYSRCAPENVTDQRLSTVYSQVLMMMVMMVQGNLAIHEVCSTLFSLCIHLVWEYPEDLGLIPWHSLGVGTPSGWPYTRPCHQPAWKSREH